MLGSAGTSGHLRPKWLSLPLSAAPPPMGHGTLCRRLRWCRPRTHVLRFSALSADGFWVWAISQQATRAGSAGNGEVAAAFVTRCPGGARLRDHTSTEATRLVAVARALNVLGRVLHGERQQCPTQRGGAGHPGLRPTAKSCRRRTHTQHAAHLGFRQHTRPAATTAFAKVCPRRPSPRAIACKRLRVRGANTRRERRGDNTLRKDLFGRFAALQVGRRSAGVWACVV